MDIRSRIISQRKMRVLFPAKGNEWKNPEFFDGFPITSLVMGEMKPSIHTIKVCSKPYWRNNRKVKKIVKTYTLAFPYVQFFMLKLLARKAPAFYPFATWTPEPLVIMSQKVAPVLLPNVYSSGKICLGAGWDFYKGDLESIPSLFWGAEFSREDDWRFEGDIRGTPLKSLTHWEKLTKKHNNPDFMLDLISLKHDETFAEMIS